MRRWTWSWESFIIGGAAVGGSLRWIGASLLVTAFWAVLVGILLAFEEKKGALILPRRLGR